MKVFIYALLDPSTKEVRYIGKSVNPKRRYYEHLTSKSKYNCHKNNWIKKLLSENIKPVLEIIEECNKENWCEREKHWIAQYDNLTNATEGGEDGRMSDEVKARMSILNSGKNNPNYGKKASKKTRDLISNRLKDRTLSEEHQNNIGKKNSRPIIIDGVDYESLSDAGRKLNLSTGYICHRLNDNSCDNFQYKT